MGGPGHNEQLNAISNEDLKRCINRNGYVVPDGGY